MHYAGVGSRRTPSAMLRLMHHVARYLAGLGYALRTGGAEGADTAFAQGALEAGGAVELYLPWPDFGHWTEAPNLRIHTGAPPPALAEARAAHPAWERTRPASRKLLGRNARIILGPDLDDPVRFVVLWTPGGKPVGGTGVAWRIAERHGVPVVHLGEGARALDRIAELVEEGRSP